MSGLVVRVCFGLHTRPVFTPNDLHRYHTWGKWENSSAVMLVSLNAYRMLVAEGLLGEAHDAQMIDAEATA